jgi:four helix bundle protein
MATVKSFRDLKVYQAGREGASSIFEVSRTFPPEERYSLTDQIRRSSRSVCANTAEAWRKRRYPAAFVSKLSDADAEAAETRAWLDAAFDAEYIDEAVFRQLDDRYDHICAQLRLMMDNPDQWCDRRRGAKSEEG